MEVAAKSEDYEEAARTRDSLKSFEEEEPVLGLRSLMKQDAARYRSELKEIAPHTPLKCLSDATTLGIRKLGVCTLRAEVNFPRAVLFTSRERITNNSDRPVQLLRGCFLFHLIFSLA